MSNKKMDDVFFLPLLADEDWVFQSDEEDGAIECDHEEYAEAIALAVNNHDALVESLILMTDLAEQYAEEMPEATVKASDIIAAKTLLKAIKGDK